MEFSPNNTLGKRIGSTLTLITLFLAGMVFWAATVWPVGMEPLAVRILGWGLVMGGGYCGWHTFCLHRLRYRITDQGELAVRFGLGEKVYGLALAQMSDTAEYDYVTQFSGVRWAGCFVGSGQIVTGAGERVAAEFWATRPLSEQVLLQTTEVIIGLTGPLPDTFQNRLVAQPQAIGAQLFHAPDANRHMISGQTDIVSAEMRKPAATPRQIDLLWLISGGLYLLLWVVLLIRLIWGDGSMDIIFLGRPLGVIEGLTQTVFPMLGGLFLGLNWVLAEQMRSKVPELVMLLGVGSILEQVLLLSLMILSS